MKSLKENKLKAPGSSMTKKIKNKKEKEMKINEKPIKTKTIKVRKEKVLRPAIKPVIPRGYPADAIIAISNLPNNYKEYDIISALTNFGTVTYFQKLSTKKALVAFLNAEEAEAAIAAKGIRVVGGRINIRRRSLKGQQSQLSDTRTVNVFRIDPTTTEDDIRQHFKKCGAIKLIQLLKRKSNPYFKIEFEDDAKALAALKLHNTILKESTINVRLKSAQPTTWDIKRTIVLCNPNGLTKVEGTKVMGIFETCGEIEKCDVYCDKKRLAILSFKQENSVEKALSLNNTTKQGIKLEMEMLSSKVQKKSFPAKSSNEKLINLLKTSKKSKICIQKVAEELNEKDIFNLFNTCGPVKCVNIADDRSAIVEFQSIEGYCKAFLLHNYKYGGKNLALQPYSQGELPQVIEKKASKSKKKQNKKNKNKPAIKLEKKNKLKLKAK